jgi:CheY-like chemotaxis protein
MNAFLNSLSKKPSGAFIFIDDQKDEHSLLKLSMQELGLDNEIISFMNGEDAFNYLKKTKKEIFLILSDLNMPKVDGLELKRMIEMTPELKVKAILFFFHSSSAGPIEIRAAYALNIQAYILKSPSLEGTIQSLQKIVALWTDCVHPKDLENL